MRKYTHSFKNLFCLVAVVALSSCVQHERLEEENPNKVVDTTATDVVDLCDKSCDDENPCTTDICIPETGKCEKKAVDKGTSCDLDDNACTLDTCKGGECMKGKVKNCDDENPCTDDKCNNSLKYHANGSSSRKAECVNKPVDFADCDDGNNCTEKDKCLGGKCTGKKMDCDDGESCTNDVCQKDGTCNHFPMDGASCDDGNPCTSGDKCVDDVCEKTGDTKCDDGNPCTYDSCDENTGCTNSAGSKDGSKCDDGDACTEETKCKDGACVGKKVDCDDGKPCTVDSCDSDKGCDHLINDSLSCSDGNACTAGEECSEGECTGGKPTDCSDPNPCTLDSCDKAKGCLHEVAPKGSQCNDGNPCTENDSCIQGACLGAKSKDCNDNDQCTDDYCDPKTGKCSHKTSIDSCDDNDACTEGDKCVAGKCAGELKNCSDGKQCTADKCDPAQGCSNTAMKDGTSCNLDDNPCTIDTCQSGKCDSKPKSCDDGKLCMESKCNPSDGSCTYSKKDCDDGNKCTADSCDVKTGNCAHVKDEKCTECKVHSDCANDSNPCVQAICLKGLCNTTQYPVNASCDDGNKCTGGEFCQDGACKGGKSKSCNDGNPCTADSCDPNTGNCAHSTVKVNGTPCDDGESCTKGETCNGGKCEKGIKTVCDDKKPCTIDSCNTETGNCVYDASSQNGKQCDDGKACTDSDKCTGGKCVGEAKACNDNNPCTIDSCDQEKGCVSLPNACSDGDACTTDTCIKDKGCSNAPKIGCGLYCKTVKDCKDDGNSCTVNSCDNGKCAKVLEPNIVSCDDGDKCTLKGNCLEGACVNGKLVVCNDNNDCTADTCDPKKGCVYTNIVDDNVCDDGNACNGVDTCKGGKCTSGKKDSSCNDGVPCTTDNCDPKTGCTHVIDTSKCDDKNPCTNDTCDPKKGCVWTANTVACDDGDKCTQADVCKDGKCAPGAKATCDDSKSCTDDSCDPKTGTCQYKVNDKNSCTDGDACTVDVCKAGQCESSGKNCNDDNQCTKDSCNAKDGKCVYVVKVEADVAQCDDADACTVNEKCDKQAKCGSGEKVVCNDNNPCTDDSCNSKTGCKFTNNDANACSDGDACTVKDSCKAGECKAGSPAACSDGNDCTTDTCDKVKGCVNANNSAACSDDNLCTVEDVCKDGKCVTKLASCDDSNVCTTDSCDSKTGKCVNKAVQDGSKCDDGDLCTSGDNCKSGKCDQAKNTKTCDDNDPCTLDNVCILETGNCPSKNPTLTCDDNNSCTKDSCGPDPADKTKAKCTNVSDDSLTCTDGKECTTDTCKSGKCIHDAKPNCTEKVKVSVAWKTTNALWEYNQHKLAKSVVISGTCSITGPSGENLPLWNMSKKHSVDGVEAPIYTKALAPKRCNSNLVCSNQTSPTVTLEMMIPKGSHTLVCDKLQLFLYPMEDDPTDFYAQAIGWGIGKDAVHGQVSHGTSISASLEGLTQSFNMGDSYKSNGANGLDITFKAFEPPAAK